MYYGGFEKSQWALRTGVVSLIASKCCKFKNEVGLYRDSGLTICKATPKEIEKNKQEVSQVFKSNGLKIRIDANKKIVNFLHAIHEFSLITNCRVFNKATTPQRVWTEGGGVLNKCQLSVKILAVCQMSVKPLLIINYETCLFIFQSAFSLKIRLVLISSSAIANHDVIITKTSRIFSSRAYALVSRGSRLRRSRA